MSNVDNDVEESAEEKEDYSRVVPVLIKFIGKYRKVLVNGSRDVGKSLYVRQAVLTLTYQHEEQGKRYLPVFLECPISADIVLQLTRFSRFRTENTSLPPHYDIIPIIVLDNAHRCSDEDLMRINSQLPKDAKLVLIAPSAGIRPSKSEYFSYRILPFRFVEVAETIVDKDIRYILKRSHLEGCGRIDNLSSINKVHELLEKIRGSSDHGSLMKLFRCYLIYGGTAHGVRYISDCINNKELKGISHAFFKSVGKILDDAKEYSKYYEGIDYALFQVAIQATMMYIAEKVMKKGLEVDQNKLYEEVREMAQRISPWWNIGRKDVDVNRAVLNAIKYLKESGVIVEIKPIISIIKQRSKPAQQDKSANVVKYVFTDPRYLIGAYLYHTHMIGSKEYTEAFDEVVAAINDLVQTQKRQGTIKPEYYLEAITLSNLALGAYAMSVSCGKPDRDSPPLSKYINYVKADGREIDALIKVGYFDKSHGEVGLSILFEVSRSFDEDHVSKCKEALNDIKASYCIYATLDVNDVKILGDDNIIVAPLPYALLLF